MESAHLRPILHIGADKRRGACSAFRHFHAERSVGGLIEIAFRSCGICHMGCHSITARRHLIAACRKSGSRAADSVIGIGDGKSCRQILQSGSSVCNVQCAHFHRRRTLAVPNQLHLHRIFVIMLRTIRPFLSHICGCFSFIYIINIEVQDCIVIIIITNLEFARQFWNAVVVFIRCCQISCTMIRFCMIIRLWPPADIFRFDDCLYIFPFVTLHHNSLRNSAFIFLNVNHGTRHIQIIIVFAHATTDLNH